MSYSAVSDLLVGDMLISASFDKASFVNTAAEEMDAKFGFIYKLPLHLPTVQDVDANDDSWKQLPKHETLLLKGVNNRLASGRLILALDISGEGTTMHGYGWQLVKEATAEMLMIANGDVDLTAARAEYGGVKLDTTPSIKNHDEESLYMGFEENIMRRHVPWRRWITQPGDAAKGPFF